MSYVDEIDTISDWLELDPEVHKQDAMIDTLIERHGHNCGLQIWSAAVAQAQESRC